MRTVARLGVMALLLGCATRASATNDTLTKQQEAEVTRTLEAELREANVPGAAVAIVRDGRLAYVHAFGVRSLEERTPVTPDTLFRLGSTTKMLTALVALDAAAKGRLDLDAPVSTYVKDLDPALGALTLRRLLSHTAGMREASPSVQSLDDSGLSRMVSGWKADYRFAPPGEVFSYSGPGYWLSGLVLESVYGKPYADVMREQLFQPVGMARSTLRPLVALTTDFAQGHEGASDALQVVRPMAENTAMYPAGSVFSSAVELAKLATTVLDGGRSGGNRVLAERAVRDFFTADVPLPGGDTARYGYGLVKLQASGVSLFEHGGVRRGYGSHIRFIPERRGAIIVLTNENGVTLYRSVEHITRSVFGVKPDPEPQREVPPLTADEAPRYTGTYVHADLARFTLAWDGARLVLKGDTDQPLTRTGPETFRTREGQEFAFVFLPGQPRARYLHTDLLSLIRAPE